jgi:meso-butanediol dehydrogenase/(S,S)-butanediol dehydrogenase/diacetyl reductase
VADEAQATALIDATVDRFGWIDVLINNAAVLVTGKIAHVSTADWRKIMSANVDGVFFCTHAGMPHLIRSRDSVVTRRFAPQPSFALAAPPFLIKR